MNRMFTKNFIVLLVAAVVLAGLSAVMLLLTPQEAREGNFWISFWMILLAGVLIFASVLLHLLAAGRGGTPLPLLLAVSTTATLYGFFVLAAVGIFHYWLDIGVNAYLAVHVGGFLLLVGGGGALSLLSLSAGETDMGASLKRSRLFVLTTRIASLGEELRLSPYRSMLEDILPRLRELNEALRYSDPMASDEMEEGNLVAAVSGVEEKARRFMAAATEGERRKIASEFSLSVDRAFSVLELRNEAVRQSKK
ncbi:MAG: hypothetical protein VB045_07575 [Synergistaceae bacterium]|nr:hypothetical protein [Synergistaceae bacterium]